MRDLRAKVVVTGKERRHAKVRGGLLISSQMFQRRVFPFLGSLVERGFKNKIVSNPAFGDLQKMEYKKQQRKK